MTHLINLSIFLGIVLDERKVARVIPIFKGEDEHLVQNNVIFMYCIFLSKIFETIVTTYATEFLDYNLVFYRRQLGLRQNHYTTHAIITLVEQVSKSLDTGKYVVGIHNIIFRKL